MQARIALVVGGLQPGGGALTTPRGPLPGAVVGAAFTCITAARAASASTSAGFAELRDRPMTALKEFRE